MRFLIVDTAYSSFISWFYAQNPTIAGASYAEQYQAIDQAFFHSACAWAKPLRDLGHDVLDITANNPTLQVRWCLENGLGDVIKSCADEYILGGISIKSSRSMAWLQEIVTAQIREFQPDILLSANIYAFDSKFLFNVKKHYKLAIGQHAAPLMAGCDLSKFDLMISSMPVLVDHFRSLGLKAEYLRLAFDERLLSCLKDGPCKYDLTFIGQAGALHQKRQALLLALAQQIPLDFFGDGDISSANCGQLRQHPALWGLNMYQALKDSRITLNSHLDIAGDFANNLRLYEACGVGSVLLTDRKSNLSEMFKEGEEILAYDSPAEALELAQYYLKEPIKRDEMAQRAQARVLREHTYIQRVHELLEIINKA